MCEKELRVDSETAAKGHGRTQSTLHLCHRCMVFKDESAFYKSCLRCRIYKCIDCIKTTRYEQIAKRRQESPAERRTRLTRRRQRQRLRRQVAALLQLAEPGSSSGEVDAIEQQLKSAHGRRISHIVLPVFH